MKNFSRREIKIFFEKETENCFIRVFKFRNYEMKGGKTFCLKKNSKTLVKLFKIIVKNSVEPIVNESFLWDDTKEVATTYVLEMKGEKV